MISTSYLTWLLRVESTGRDRWPGRAGLP